MGKKRKITSLIIFGCIILLLVTGIILTGGGEGSGEPIREVMRDAVLHESVKVSFFGMKVNPGVASAFTVTGIIFVFAIIVRIFFIPRFKMIPGRLQLLLEQAVGMFDGMAKQNSPHRNGFLGAYIFSAGTYICLGTLFELFGVQAVTTTGASVSLPAPLSDINGAISLGCLSYLIILSGGIVGNKFKGVLNTLKDFSLPISMSFRLFGALLSGALVTELVYYYTATSYVIPVAVGVMFTLLHSLIQAYVLTMLTALFYGEVSEPSTKKVKKNKKSKETAA